MNNSVILTIHNKDFLIGNVLLHLLENLSPFNNELIIVFDGCVDNSESITKQILSNVKNKKIKYIYTDDVFETKANNAGLKVVENDYVIIIQDDMVVKEKNFDLRMVQPFLKFDDVFAVTSFIAHNNIYNEETKEINYIDIANRSNSARDIFYGREYANRGPLMYNYNDVVKLNFLDEYFSPQNYDDMDISMRALKQLGKISGLYWIDYESDLSWGTTRRSPSPKLNNIFKINGAKILERHKDLLYSTDRIIDNRILK